VIQIEQFAAEIPCGRQWIPCTVVGVVGDDEMPQFVVMFVDSDGMTTLMRNTGARAKPSLQTLVDEGVQIFQRPTGHFPRSARPDRT